jgi:iron complex transport system permease protein
MPRIVSGFLIGGGLALCGMIFQNIFHSTLATPFTLGTSSGAAFGAAIAIHLGLTSFSIFPMVSTLAFMGALLATSIVHLIAHYKKNCSMAEMLLAGVAVNFFFASLLLLIQYLSDQHTSFEIIHWLFGQLGNYTYKKSLWLLPILLFGYYLYRIATPLDLLTIGDELAHTRGLNVRKFRSKLFLLVSMVIALVVSTCGPIGFVGMMAPHICRKIVGPSHHRLVIASFCFGGSFLVICDGLARSLAPPLEIPVGIVTAILGGPFFIFILLNRSQSNS